MTPVRGKPLNPWESAYCLAVSIVVLAALVLAPFDSVQFGLGVVLVGLFPTGVATIFLARRWPPSLVVATSVAITGATTLMIAFVATVERGW